MTNVIKKLQQQAYKIVTWEYVFAITVEIDGVYWEIYLKEQEETSKFAKSHVWGNPGRPTHAEITTNEQYVLVSNDEITRLLPLSSRGVKKTNEIKVNRIKEKKEKQKARAKFHELLKQFGIEFKIDFNQYKEDVDYMMVFIDSKEVFSGSTEDLQNLSDEEYRKRQNLPPKENKNE